jgi:hypothetical protein
MTMLAFVAAGVGIGFSSLNAAALTPRHLKMIPLAEGSDVTTSLVWKASKRNTRPAYGDRGSGAASGGRRSLALIHTGVGARSDVRGCLRKLRQYRPLPDSVGAQQVFEPATHG